jgi:hypothetical protein
MRVEPDPHRITIVFQQPVRHSTAKHGLTRRSGAAYNPAILQQWKPPWTVVPVDLRLI